MACKPLDAAWIYSVLHPGRLPRAGAKGLACDFGRTIAELEQADEYVFGVAMHNFSIPSVLKLWIDQVVRAGRTFSYTASGPQGLLQGKKATILVASGGVYEAGSPASAMNFIDPYLKTILAFIGITDVKFVSAGGAPSSCPAPSTARPS